MILHVLERKIVNGIHDQSYSGILSQVNYHLTTFFMFFNVIFDLFILHFSFTFCFLYLDIFNHLYFTNILTTYLYIYIYISENKKVRESAP